MKIQDYSFNKVNALASRLVAGDMDLQEMKAEYVELCAMAREFKMTDQIRQDGFKNEFIQALEIKAAIVSVSEAIAAKELELISQL